MHQLLLKRLCVSKSAAAAGDRRWRMFSAVSMSTAADQLHAASRVGVLPFTVTGCTDMTWLKSRSVSFRLGIVATFTSEWTVELDSCVNFLDSSCRSFSATDNTNNTALHILFYSDAQ